MADLLPVFEEDIMASQILEIIGGIAPKALQTLEEPCHETDTWSMEEGDDSVFYSDEDTPQAQVVILETRRRVNSEADATPQQEDEQEERNIKTVHCIAQEEEKMDIEHKLKYPNQSGMIFDMLVSSHDEASQMMNIDSAAQSSSKDHKDFCSSAKFTEEPVASNQQSDTYLPSLEVYRKPEEKHGSQDSSQGQSIPVLSKKKSSHPRSFNHLTSSKYSTLSYRKIRRGNTRQKIEEFEYMIMNL